MLTFQNALPEETGIPSQCVIRMIRRLERYQIPMHSILLLRHDKLIAEGYYAPYTADTLHRMFSVSKSFTSVAIGLLEAEGKLSLDDPIVRYFPDKLPKRVHPWIAEMTIRDMLMMRTCHASTTYKLDMESDWVESFFIVPPTHPAGTIFHYDTSSAHTLCALAERLSGMPMLDYLKRKLAPLGLSEASYMLKDPFGVSIGGSGLVATPADLLRFGYLVLHDGLVEGEQLVPASYLKTATSRLSDTRMTAPVRSESCGYGYQFWQNERGGALCYGMGGQFVFFLPEYDLLCVTTADTQGIGGGNQFIHDALYEEILPYVQDAPLPVGEDAAQLAALLRELRIAPLSGELSSPCAAQVNGVRYRAAENPMGFSSMGVRFGDDTSGGELLFTLHGKPYALPFGFGSLSLGSFPLYDMRSAASACWVTENTLYLKAHIIDEYVGSVHFEIAFAGDTATVFLKKQEESLFGEFNGHLYLTRDESGE